MNYLILLCGGKSERLSLDTPKQYIKVKNEYIFEYSLEEFINSKLINKFIFVAEPQYFSLIKATLDNFDIDYQLVEGGKTRQESVYNGLKNIEANKDDFVFIHDSARPLINETLINELYEEVLTKNSAVPTYFVNSAIYNTSKNDYENRKNLREIQTPQAFNLAQIKLAHEEAIKNGIFDALDDGFLFNKFINKINLVENNQINIKITYESDFKIVKGILENGSK